MYINDFFNTIEIEDILNKVFADKRLYAVKNIKEVELVVPCLYHRNNPRYFDSIITRDYFKNVKYLEFPYTTEFQFKDYPSVKVVIYDDFHDVDYKNNPEEARKVFNSYSITTCKSSGDKMSFRVYVKYEKE